jgi:hypothetical protein
MILFRNLPEYQVVVKGYKVQISFPRKVLASMQTNYCTSCITLPNICSGKPM